MSVRCLLIAFACLGFVPFAAHSRDLPPTQLEPLNATTDSGNSASSPLPGGAEHPSATNSCCSSSSTVSTSSTPAEGDALHNTNAADNSNGGRDSTASYSDASSSSRSENQLRDNSSTDGPQATAKGMFLHLLKITFTEKDFESFMVAMVLGGFQWACVCLYMGLVLSMWWRMGWLC